MYRQFYNLRLNPFKIEPDPEFLWLGEKHREGLATLQYGILESKGFILLTGDVGTGKTVLLHQLRKTLPAQVKVAVIQDPGIEVLDLYRILSEDFEITGRFEGKANFLIQFKRFLIDAYAAQQQLLIIIDEAHRLSCELLDEIRVLSNIDYDNRMLINVFFVGQGEFNRMLMDRRNQAVRQRIAVSYHLSPLDEQETQAYIRHRLMVAGSEKDLFTSEALHEIFRLTGGTPRLINVVCDRSLVTGYVSGLERIGAETSQNVAGLMYPWAPWAVKIQGLSRAQCLRSTLTAKGATLERKGTIRSTFSSRLPGFGAETALAEFARTFSCFACAIRGTCHPPAADNRRRTGL
jgi:general secretion pathway protein A